ncbi:MAG: hypothetical protein RLO50_13465 [Azospirillaceae bacterium]
MLRVALMILALGAAGADRVTDALAQLPDPQGPDAAPIVDGGAADAAAALEPDLTALRYYIEIGDWSRVEAELRRLREEYPTWSPPPDLLGGEAAPQVNVQEVWDLFGAGDYAGARARLAEIEEANPGFAPPEDLLRELNLAESRQRLVNASDLEQWQRVLDIATETPGLLTCARVDNVWRTADAYAELGQIDSAFMLWRTVVETCTNIDERIATLQKADAYVDVAQLDTLISLALTRSPGAEDRILQARDDLLAGRGLEAEPVDMAEVQEESGDASTVSLPPPRPITQPASAGGGGGAPATPAGPSVAERAAQAQARADYGECLSLTQSVQEPGARLVRAWCLFELDRPTEANMLFGQVIAATSDAGIRETAQFGEVLSLLRSNRLAEAGVAMRSVSLTPAQQRDIDAEILAQRATSAYAGNDFRETIRLVRARRDLGVTDRRDLNIIMAWSYYQTGQLAEAEDLFRQLDQVFSTAESREGLSVVRNARRAPF